MNSHRPDLHRRKQGGFVLVWTIIFFAVFFAMIATFTDFTANYFRSTKRTMQTLNALAVAEAGADHFMTKINLDNDYAGTNGALGQTDTCSNAAVPFTVFNTTSQGKGVFDTCVQAGTITNEKIVVSTGKIYFPATAANPTVSRKIKLIIRGTQQAGYTVFSGSGGLNLSNNVSLTSGPIYIGGKLTMSNNSTIGTVANPVTVSVSDNACPSPATASYPQNCGNNQGSPAYSIQVSNGAYIRGPVSAPNTISDLTHLTNPGFVSNSVPTVTPPPDDHYTIVATITNSSAPANANCSGGGTVNWSANTKFTGNVSTSNNCNVTAKGDVWITGNLTMGNNATIKVDDSLVSPPYLVIDGSTGLNTGNNSAFLPNAAGIGFRVVTFYSSNAAGSGPNACSPSCASVTGIELAKSQTITTINLANNFSSGSGSFFYSRWTALNVGNNATVGAIAGQTINLNNNGNLIFNSSTALGFLTWDVKYYEQL